MTILTAALFIVWVGEPTTRANCRFAMIFLLCTWRCIRDVEDAVPYSYTDILKFTVGADIIRPVLSGAQWCRPYVFIEKRSNPKVAP